MSAMFSGPALSDTISQAAPTPCMKAPMSETKLASRRSRKTRVFSGRHGLAGAAAGEFS